MVMVLRRAAHVRVPVAGECVQGAGLPQELERPVRRGETHAGVGAACPLEELNRRERAVGSLDRVKHGPTLSSEPRSGRECQSRVCALGHGATLHENDSHFQVELSRRRSNRP